MLVAKQYEENRNTTTRQPLCSTMPQSQQTKNTRAPHLFDHPISTNVDSGTQEPPTLSLHHTETVLNSALRSPAALISAIVQHARAPLSCAPRVPATNPSSTCDFEPTSCANAPITRHAAALLSLVRASHYTFTTVRRWRCSVTGTGRDADLSLPDFADATWFALQHLCACAHKCS
jgi:hypothetical protein